MSVLTQGTAFWFVDPDAQGGGAITKVTGISGINPGGAPAGQIDVTDLEDTSSKFKKGLRTPGQATATLKADPSVAAHIRLAALADEDVERNHRFIVGWSDGTAVPTLTDGVLTLPATRTFFTFEGYVSDFPFDFAANTVVQTQLTIQRSGKGTWHKKTGA